MLVLSFMSVIQVFGKVGVSCIFVVAWLNTSMNSQVIP